MRLPIRSLWHEAVFIPSEEHPMRGRLLRSLAWLSAVALILITLGPARIRPETVMPSYLQHLVAFGVSGLFFVAG
jgi:hypothetical protein